MSKNYEYLIIGAGQAGHSAADAIRKIDRDGTLAVVGAEVLRPYNRPPLSKGILGGQMDAEKAFVQKEDYYPENNIELILGTEVNGLDVANRLAFASNGTEYGFEKLLLATGGRARRLDLQGSHLPVIFTLREMRDALAIREASAMSRRIVVIGGGFIGAEAAATLSGSGKHVTMIFPEKRILQRLLPEDFALHLHGLYANRGVEIISEDVPDEYEGDDNLKAVLTKGGKRLECDMAVLGVGIELNTGFLSNTGLEMTEGGAVVTDERMRTSIKDIWAAGDIAAYHDINFERRLRLEHYYIAQRHGQAAGTDMAGVALKYTELPYFFSGIFDQYMQIYGRFNPADVIRRGKPEEGSVAYFSFNEDVLEGYFCVGRPEEEQQTAKRLILERLNKAKIAEALADESRDLDAL